MNKLIISALLLSMIYTLGCSKKQTAQVNPNGDSELAVLMREMFEDGMDVKEAIEKGKLPKSHVEVEKLLTAEATDPKQVAMPEYEAYARVYQANYQAMLDAETDQQRETAYKSLVQTCISCHEATCPGPIVRIKKMELSE